MEELIEWLYVFVVNYGASKGVVSKKIFKTVVKIRNFSAFQRILALKIVGNRFKTLKFPKINFSPFT